MRARPWRSARGDCLDADASDRLQGVDEPRVVGREEDELRSLPGGIFDERIRVGLRGQPAEGVDPCGTDDPDLVGESVSPGRLQIVRTEPSAELLLLAVARRRRPERALERADIGVE